MYQTFVSRSLLLAGALAAGCAGTPGAQPHDMSATGHEQAAKEAEAAAAMHKGQFDPAAAAERCKRPQKDPSTPCWTMQTNPTSEHLGQAERMHKAAADHRAASQALRDAEASACAGIDESDRDTSPLLRSGDVTAVEDLRASNTPQKAPVQSRLAGAAVTVRAVPGLTKEYLQRLVTCHLARSSSMGHDMAEMASCPLAVRGASATVESAGSAFRVEVTSSDDAAAAEIARRARTLVTAP